MNTRLVAVAGAVVLALSLPWSASAAACKPKLLPKAVLQLVKPLLKARIQRVKELGRGVQDADSPATRIVDELLGEVLRNGTTSGDAAPAYLLSVNVGDHYNEDIVCEVLSRGRKMLPLARAVKDCRPNTGLEPLPPSVGSVPDPYVTSVTENLESGEGCGQ